MLAFRDIWVGECTDVLGVGSGAPREEIATLLSLPLIPCSTHPFHLAVVQLYPL